MKHIARIFACALLALSSFAFAKTGANKANTSKVTYNLLSGGTMTNQAEGKPKILIFFQANDAKSREVAKNVAASYSSLSSSVDICFVETKRSSKAIVTKFRDNYASSSVNVAYDSTTAAATSMQEYMKLLIGKAASISNPLVVFIDKNNKVQHEAHGQKFTVAQIKEFATDYVGANFSSSGGNSNSGGNVTTPDFSASVIGSVSSAYKGITLNGKLLDKTAEVRVNGATIKGSKLEGREDSDTAGVFIEGRTVTLSPFIIGKYEVTQELYEAVMQGKKVTVNGKLFELSSKPSLCTSQKKGFEAYTGEIQKYRPVENVTWYDAVYFCNVLSEIVGLKKAYQINVERIEKDDDAVMHIKEATVEIIKGANGYRLPTEAEWEFAARGGNPNSAEWEYYFSGENSSVNSVGWWTGNSPEKDKGCTHEVGKLKPNSLGIYDMSGNVYELCFDRFDWKEGGALTNTIKTGTVTNPTNKPSGKASLVAASRGGSSGCCATVWLLTTARQGAWAHRGHESSGIRLVRAAE